MLREFHRLKCGRTSFPGGALRLAIGWGMTLWLATLAEAQQPLRIVTFNAEILAAPRTNASKLSRFRFDTARLAHLERVAAIIETLEPDILNLVEVTSVEAVDHLIALLHEKGLTDYRGYHVESKDAFTGLDVALITRHTPDTIEGAPIRIIFSPAGDPTWRSAFTYVDDKGVEREQETSLMRNAVYYITLGKHKLGFVGLHLKSNPEDAYSNGRRTGEAFVARKIIRQEIVARGYKPIVLGDLNDYDADVPDRDETRETATNVLAMLKDYDDARQGPELFNVAAIGTIAHFALGSEREWSTTRDVKTMIDHILAHHTLAAPCRTSATRGLETSDHYPSWLTAAPECAGGPPLFARLPS